LRTTRSTYQRWIGFSEDDAKQFAEGARPIVTNYAISHQGKLRRAAGQAGLRRSTEFLLSPKIANV
jgi:hypothetical protein